jgi:hypothetical protein
VENCHEKNWTGRVMKHGLVGESNYPWQGELRHATLRPSLPVHEGEARLANMHALLL